MPFPYPNHHYWPVVSPREHSTIGRPEDEDSSAGDEFPRLRIRESPPWAPTMEEWLLYFPNLTKVRDKYRETSRRLRPRPSKPLNVAALIKKARKASAARRRRQQFPSVLPTFAIRGGARGRPPPPPPLVIASDNRHLREQREHKARSPVETKSGRVWEVRRDVVGGQRHFYLVKVPKKQVAQAPAQQEVVEESVESVEVVEEEPEEEELVDGALVVGERSGTEESPEAEDILLDADEDGYAGDDDEASG